MLFRSCSSVLLMTCLSFVASEHCDDSASDQTACKSFQSWTPFAKEEDESSSIELLQIQASPSADGPKKLKGDGKKALMHQQDKKQKAVVFEDFGRGCCVGIREEAQGKLWADYVESLDDCKNKCLANPDCGFIEYGWGEDEGLVPSRFCFMWNKNVACPVSIKLAEACGGNSGDNGVHVYKLTEQVGEDIGIVPQRALTFVTVFDDFFHANLGASSLYQNRQSLPHEWMVINNTKNTGISTLYAQAQRQALHDIIVFLHSDVSLPEDFYMNFMKKLKKVEDVDPNWGVLGTAAIPNEEDPNIKSSIEDCFHVFHTGEDNLQVSAFDEHLLVLSKSHSPMFDDQLPGFDLYGTDIALNARARGQKSYLLNVPVAHKVLGPTGGRFNASEFSERLETPEWKARVESTVAYFQNKWCSSGFLPISSPAFHVECDSYKVNR